MSRQFLASLDEFSPAKVSPTEMNFMLRHLYEICFVVKTIRRSQFRSMSEDLKKTIGLVVRARRQRLRLTQEELASQIDRTPESVSNIERGLHLPSVDTLVDLGRELGISMSDFFEQETAAKVTPERAQLEAQLRELGRSLDDRDLKIVVRLLNVALEIAAS